MGGGQEGLRKKQCYHYASVIRFKVLREAVKQVGKTLTLML